MYLNGLPVKLQLTPFLLLCPWVTKDGHSVCVLGAFRNFDLGGSQGSVLTNRPHPNSNLLVTYLENWKNVLPAQTSIISPDKVRAVFHTQESCLPASCQDGGFSGRKTKQWKDNSKSFSLEEQKRQMNLEDFLLCVALFQVSLTVRVKGFIEFKYFILT